MWHGENDELANATRMSRSREPRHGGSPIVANDVCPLNTERVKDANYIAYRVLQRIGGHAFRAIGTSQATQIRRDCVEAVLHEERDLVAPKICGVRPSVEQEHRPAAAVVLYMKRNSVNSHFGSPPSLCQNTQ